MAEDQRTRPVTTDHKPATNRHEVTSGPVWKLLQDESGVTTLEYVVAAVALALAAVAASRLIARILVSYLHRIYLVVTLPVP
jgi:Flp pilus assembly pilin Flp